MKAALKAVAKTIFVLGLCILFLARVSCRADERSQHIDDYLDSQYDWAMCLDVGKAQHYLNYEGSRLHPLDKVRITFRQSPRSSAAIAASATTTLLYEELWYHQGVPIGSQRRAQLKINRQKLGTILLRSSGLEPVQAGEALNAAIRLFVDLQLMQQNINTFVVPLEYYALMSADLGKYRFYQPNKAQKNAMSGPQLSIRLLSYPSGRDETFFFQK